MADRQFCQGVQDSSFAQFYSSFFHKHGCLKIFLLLNEFMCQIDLKT